MEAALDLAEWWLALAVQGTEATVGTMTTHWRQVVWVVGGALLWTVAQPVLYVTFRFWSAVGRFIYKWTELTKICFRRYQRFSSGAKLRARARGDRWWTLYEALWATPMVVLEARQEHLQGLGRLIYKWLDAFHAYWCVFLPDTVEASGRLFFKYWVGTRSAISLSWDRAGRALRLVYSVSYVLVYATVYGSTLGYEWIEWACQGWPGVTVLLVSLNYYFAAEGGSVNYYGYSLDREVALASGVFTMVGVLSHLSRWYSVVAEGGGPVQLAENRYAAWLKDMEEQEQAERLSEAFWRLDGAVPGAPRVTVPTLSGREAERRLLQAQMKAARREEAAYREEVNRRAQVTRQGTAEGEYGRRGRRPGVGEIVTSEIDRHGGHRLGHGVERPWAAETLRTHLFAEQLVDDQRSSAARVTRVGPQSAGWP